MATEHKYKWTEDMGEISGFGGSYEQACRAMVLRGADWLEDNKKEDLKFSGLKGVFGIITPESDEAKELEKYMTDLSNEGIEDEGLTGAMVHASINHVMYIARNGWDKYSQELRDRESE